MIEQILGWVGNIGFLFGALLLTRKKIYGWHLQIVANLLYVIQAHLLGNYSLLVLSIILIFVNIYGCYNWTKNKQ